MGIDRKFTHPTSHNLCHLKQHKHNNMLNIEPLEQPNSKFFIQLIEFIHDNNRFSLDKVASNTIINKLHSS